MPDFSDIAEKSRSVLSKTPDGELLVAFEQLKMKKKLIMKTKSIILNPFFFFIVSLFGLT
jgi:hypothetical protein